MSYQQPVELYYCVVVDDHNIGKLINVIDIVGGKFVYVHVVVYVVVEEGDRAKEVVDRGKTSTTNIFNRKESNNPISTFITPHIPQYHSVVENVNIVPQPIMHVEPLNYKYVGNDPIGTYLSDVGAHDYFCNIPKFRIKNFIFFIK